MGVINQELNDASLETHIILEIMWGHLFMAIVGVVALAIASHSNPFIITNRMCTLKDARIYSQRRAM
jgi:hypothetical protein